MKAEVLNSDIMTAATRAPVAPAEPKRVKPAPKAKMVPLQVRWPASNVKAAKLADIQRDFSSVSEFMLRRFHACTNGCKQPEKLRYG